MVSGVNEIAALGPFFAFEVHEGDGPARAPWREMAELVDDPAVLAGRAADVRGHLAGGRPVESVELRVAASVMHLGLTARLASPALAVATRYGAVLPLDLREARWQPVPGGMFPLSLPRRTLVPVADPAELAAALGVELLDGPCRAMVEATLPLCPSPQILWGNVASAVHGAAVALANSRPQLAGRARLLAGLVLAQPQLRDTCTGVGDGGPFRRRSCCLIYRAAPGGAGALCGDCVLRRG